MLIREGVTQGVPQLMVLYRITLSPLVEELRDTDLGFLSPLYTDKTALNGLVWRSARMERILLELGSAQG